MCGGKNAPAGKIVTCASSLRLVKPLQNVVGVPARRAAPLLEVNEIPGGSVPVLEIVGVGQPVVVIWNDDAWPLVNVTLEELVIFGASRTESVKF